MLGGRAAGQVRRPGVDQHGAHIGPGKTDRGPQQLRVVEDDGVTREVETPGRGGRRPNQDGDEDHDRPGQGQQTDSTHEETSAADAGRGQHHQSTGERREDGGRDDEPAPVPRRSGQFDVHDRRQM